MTADPDPYFADPRLAATYDTFEGDRGDLDLYVEIAEELGAGRVLDVGCGTGELACRLARRGLVVTGVDPARSSVDIARSKPGADAVRWVVGTASDVASTGFDLATMTANVAQVFIADLDWETTLGAIAAAVRPGGTLVFETRDPTRWAWERWTPEHTRATADIGPDERATTWCEVTDVSPPLVSFRWTTTFTSDGAAITSDSTLRFRTRSELDATLDAHGFDVVDVRDAPDRPGLEWVYLARRR